MEFLFLPRDTDKKWRKQSCEVADALANCLQFRIKAKELLEQQTQVAFT